MDQPSAFNKLRADIEKMLTDERNLAIPAMKNESIEQLRSRYARIDALQQVLDLAATIRRGSREVEE